MKKLLTTPRSLYAIALKHGGKFNKAAMMLWEVPYEEYDKKENKVVRKTAAAESIGRAARTLVEDGWFGTERVNKQAIYWANTEKQVESQVIETKDVRPEPVVMRLGSNKPIAVPPERIEDYKSKGYVRI